MSLATIVIPAYNQARFLTQAIESALAQSYAPVEVIVVDDGSTDATPDILHGFAERGNVSVIRQDNRGLAAARNRGLRDARGEFVCFLDSDDFLAPAHIEQLAAALHDDPDLGFAYCDVQMVNETGAPSNTFSVGESRQLLSGDILESLLVGGYFPPHAALVRRQLLNDLGGFDLALGGNADYELWMRLASAGYRATYVDARLASYRVYEGSMSRDLDQMRVTRIGALEKIARRYPGRLAGGLSRIQELAVDLHTANRWLRSRWDSVLHEAEAARSTESWSLLQHFSDAKLACGTVDQLALWDTSLDGTFERAIFLHPPAALEISVPTGRAGRLRTAFAVHADAWTKPDAAACIFSIDVDRAVAATALLDPSRRSEDRRWVTMEIDVPASASGRHVVTLDTRTPGSVDFAWALFRDVTFR